MRKKTRNNASVEPGIPGGTSTRHPQILTTGEILLRKRINPFSRAINQARLIEKMGRHVDAYKAWLDICEFVYSKPKPYADTPTPGSQTAVNAKAAHRLLSALENAAKQSPKPETKIQEVLEAPAKEDLNGKDTEEAPVPEAPPECPREPLRIDFGPGKSTASPNPGMGDGTPAL